MTDWKQIIVGDAFKLPSRNPRYYLDLVLMVPLLFAALFLSEGIRTWHTSQFDLKEAVISGGLVCFFLLLTKDHIRKWNLQRSAGPTGALQEECEMIWPIMRKHAMAEP